MAEKEPKQKRTELYEREMKHEEHRDTPLETAGRDAGEESGEQGESKAGREPEEKG